MHLFSREHLPTFFGDKRHDFMFVKFVNFYVCKVTVLGRFSFAFKQINYT